jgi:hypothetical protein
LDWKVIRQARPESHRRQPADASLPAYRSGEDARIPKEFDRLAGFLLFPSPERGYAPPVFRAAEIRIADEPAMPTNERYIFISYARPDAAMAKR